MGINYIFNMLDLFYANKHLNEKITARARARHGMHTQ